MRVALVLGEVAHLGLGEARCRQCRAWRQLAETAACGHRPTPTSPTAAPRRSCATSTSSSKNCLGAGRGTPKLKFTIEVLKSGMPPHKIKVISSNASVRSCVRGLFEQFPFDSSPRGACYITYNNGKATFEKLPVDPPPTRASGHVLHDIQRQAAGDRPLRRRRGAGAQLARRSASALYLTVLKSPR